MRRGSGGVAHEGSDGAPLATPCTGEASGKALHRGTSPPPFPPELTQVHGSFPRLDRRDRNPIHKAASNTLDPNPCPCLRTAHRPRPQPLPLPSPHTQASTPAPAPAFAPHTGLDPSPCPCLRPTHRRRPQAPAPAFAPHTGPDPSPCPCLRPTHRPRPQPLPQPSPYIPAPTPSIALVSPPLSLLPPSGASNGLSLTAVDLRGQ